MDAMPNAISRMRRWAKEGYQEVDQPAEFAQDVRELLAAYERTREDHINVLAAALYQEVNGIDLVQRLTAFALKQRGQPPFSDPHP